MLTTSEGREDSAVLQAYDAKRKRTRMERDSGAQRKPVVTEEWRRHVAENWSLPLQLLKGRSRREVYQQLLLAVRELIGSQTRAMRCAKPSEQFLCGKVNGKVVKEIILDLRNTHAVGRPSAHKVPGWRPKAPKHVGDRKYQKREL